MTAPAPSVGTRRRAFAAVVRARRKTLRLSQQGLAERASCGRSSIVRIENASESPSMDRVFLLADGLGVDLGVLFAEEEAVSKEMLRRRAARRVRGRVLSALALAVALAGCTAPAGGPTIAAGPAAELAALTVATEDTGAHYNRADWGDWTSRGKCSTRETVLAEQGDGEAVDGECRPACPAAGEPCWTSPYDAVRTGDPAALQIDHLVPLAEAQRSGARDWTAARRRGYYNDPLNLVAVTIRANTSKGDRDPGVWRPTDRASWCGYAAGWVAVKAAYGLSADPAEVAGLGSMLAGCPGLPSG